MFNEIFTSPGDTTQIAGTAIGSSSYLTAGLIAYAIARSTFTSLLVAIVTQRESGILKRLRGTPVPAWTYIAGQLIRSIVLSVATVVVLMGIGMAFYRVPWPGERLIGFTCYVVLGTAALAAAGIALTGFLGSVDSASSVGPFVAVMLSFISGVFIPVDQLPTWLQRIGQFFPIAPVADGLQRSLIQASGTGLNLLDVGTLALWLVASVVIATRFFKWEPQGRTSE